MIAMSVRLELFSCTLQGLCREEGGGDRPALFLRRRKGLRVQNEESRSMGPALERQTATLQLYTRHQMGVPNACNCKVSNATARPRYRPAIACVVSLSCMSCVSVLCASTSESANDMDSL